MWWKWEVLGFIWGIIPLDRGSWGLDIMGDISGAVLVLYSYLSLCWLQSRMYPHGIQHHDPLPRGIIHQIKPKTSYFHQVKGSHNPNTYGKNKECITFDTNRVSPCIFQKNPNLHNYVDVGTCAKHCKGEWETSNSPKSKKSTVRFT